MSNTVTAKNIQPGMLVRANGVDCHGLNLTQFRTVSNVQHAGFSDRLVTFTDGTTALVGGNREFQVSASAATPSLTDVVAGLLIAYATATLTELAQV